VFSAGGSEHISPRCGCFEPMVQNGISIYIHIYFYDRRRNTTCKATHVDAMKVFRHALPLVLPLSFNKQASVKVTVKVN
jgi:hypothetical protein